MLKERRTDEEEEEVDDGLDERGELLQPIMMMDNYSKTTKEYEHSYHLGGCYKTVREESPELSMGISSMFNSSRKKNDDGYSIPLTNPILPANKENTLRFKLVDKCKRFFRNVIRDWIFLALLGFIMAALSFGMDFAILWLQNGQMLLYDLVEPIHALLAILIWVGYVVVLTIISALIAHFVAPQAIGSGIPEMKTILRGVILKEYLTIRTLISKMAGLTLSLGSGLPMGKEGPFVHVASVVAAQLGRLVHGSTTGIFENETRSAEMLAAGCAVGVACTFSAPIGGVLFSIEVTSVYFAVRNYWRGFFAATCSATLFRILRMFSVSESVTVEAHFQTNFPPQNAFMPQELPVFALIGIVCGILGSLFVYVHRRTVLFLRRNRIAKMLFQKVWIIYPLFVATLISSISFPMGLGKFMGGEERFSHTMKEFFINCTWTAPNDSVAACPWSNETSSIGGAFDMRHWKGPELKYSPFMTLSIFQVAYFFLSILASTLPVPSGIFMPVFVLGAAFGRMTGEGFYQWFPNGFSQGQFYVRPGIYAVVGAAAFCGAVTHTVSVAVIVFELTGQLCHLLPVMIAVLIANATASYLQPSIYDSIIRIKNLPYLPDIPHTSSFYHQLMIEQFMREPVIFIGKDSTLGDVKRVLEESRVRAFPLVDSKQSMALIGSIRRSHLTKMVDEKIGTKARFAEATRRVKRKMEEKEESQAAAATPSRKPSRFLVVPVKQGESQKKGVESLNAENARKILTEDDKRKLFERAGKNGKTLMANQENQMTISDIFRTISNFSFGRISDLQSKKPRNEFELYGEERIEWEKEILAEPIELSQSIVDSAPFQVSEFTSLFKVHSLFSLLGLNRAYVTKKGQLIGVVALKEIRLAVEYLQAGKMPSQGRTIYSTEEHAESMDRKATIKYERIDCNGEQDAKDDYIQPPLEVVRKCAMTPMMRRDEEEEKEENGKESRSPSTTSSCVSLESNASFWTSPSKSTNEPVRLSLEDNVELVDPTKKERHVTIRLPEL